MSFLKKLQAALVVAERDVNALNRESEYWRLRTLEAKCTAAFVAEQADTLRVQRNEAQRLVGRGHLRLMTSGISHRRYLAFVKSLESQP